MPLTPRETSSSTPEPYEVPPSQEFDGNDGSWSTFKASIGTPGQDFRLLPSTKSGVTFAIVPEGCIAGVDPSDCPNLRGAQVFNSAQSPGFQVNISSTWSTLGQYAVDLEDSLNYTANGMYGFDKVSLGPASDSTSLSLDKQVVAGIAELDYFLGYIPLGTADSSFSSLSQSIDSFLYQLRNGTQIPSLSFAYTAGAKYRLKSVFGSLILGGYDSTRFTPNSNDFSFSFATDPSKLLTVGVESITAMNTLLGTYSLSAGAHFSVIDSTVPHLWLPRDICDEFEQAFGLTYDPQTDLYLVNDTVHEELQSKNPTITIKLVNSLEDTTTNYTNIALPYGAFDLQASYPHYQNATNYFPIRRAANDTQYVLGRTLLQEAYLIVDYERANFTIAQAAFPDPLPAANIITIKSTEDASTNNSKSGLSTGAIAGIAVGGAVLGILLLAGLLFFLRKRRRSNKEKYELANNEISESGSGRHMTASPAQQQKVAHGPQELGGTPLTELASPTGEHMYGGRDQKPFLSVNDTPQELESRTPMTPRWQEVTREQFYEMDGASMPNSRNVSRNVSEMGSAAPSEDGREGSHGRYSGVSPLTGRFH